MMLATDPIRILVVDDEPLARRAVCHFLETADRVKIVGECANGRQAIDRIASTDIDLVFLDIQMPDVSGFDVIREVGIERMPAVIFVTAYDDRAVEAFETDAIDYLLKPIDEDRFFRAFARARKRIGSHAAAELGKKIAALVDSDALSSHANPAIPRAGARRIAVKSMNRTLFIDPETIYWIETGEYHVRLHCSEAEHLASETMAALERVLPSDKFVRIHRSFIVNIDRIREVQPLFHGDYVVIMDDGAELRLSRTRRRTFEQRLGRTI